MCNTNFCSLRNCLELAIFDKNLQNRNLSRNRVNQSKPWNLHKSVTCLSPPRLAAAQGRLGTERA